MQVDDDELSDEGGSESGRSMSADNQLPPQLPGYTVHTRVARGSQLKIARYFFTLYTILNMFHVV